jgi:hypothetical protein
MKTRCRFSGIALEAVLKTDCGMDAAVELIWRY